MGKVQATNEASLGTGLRWAELVRANSSDLEVARTDAGEQGGSGA